MIQISDKFNEESTRVSDLFLYSPLSPNDVLPIAHFKSYLISFCLF